MRNILFMELVEGWKQSFVAGRIRPACRRLHMYGIKRKFELRWLIFVLTAVDSEHMQQIGLIIIQYFHLKNLSSTNEVVTPEV